MHSFDLHAPKGANKKKRIVGRGQGSGLGTTAGKGNKGQQSRSGGKTYLGFEGGQMPLYRRIAHRGFSNYPFKKEYQIVSLMDIENNFSPGDTVDIPSLCVKKIACGLNPVKVLSNGVITKPVTVNIEKISAGAKEKIIKAGGSVVEVASKNDEAGKKGKKAKRKAACLKKINEGIGYK